MIPSASLFIRLSALVLQMISLESTTMPTLGALGLRSSFMPVLTEKAMSELRQEYNPLKHRRSNTDVVVWVSVLI